MNKPAARTMNDERPKINRQHREVSRWSVTIGDWLFVRRSGEAALALAAGLLAVLLLGLAYSRAWPQTLDVGARDDRFVAGFNAIEDFGGRPRRVGDVSGHRGVPVGVDRGAHGGVLRRQPAPHSGQRSAAGQPVMS